MADSKHTAFASVVAGVEMEGHKDYPDLVTVYLTFPDGTRKKMWDTTCHRDMAWMEKVQRDTKLQRFQ